MTKRIGILALGLLLAGCGDELAVDNTAANLVTSTCRCGNGIVEAPETCDDANLTDGDGCSSTCQLEPGYDCSLPGRACRRVP